MAAHRAARCAVPQACLGCFDRVEPVERFLTVFCRYTAVEATLRTPCPKAYEIERGG